MKLIIDIAVSPRQDTDPKWVCSGSKTSAIRWPRRPSRPPGLRLSRRSGQSSPGKHRPVRRLSYIYGPRTPRPATARPTPVSYTHLRAHETRHELVCRLLLEKKKKNQTEQEPARGRDRRNIWRRASPGLS